MTTLEQTQVEALFNAFAAKDLNAVIAMFDENALVYDLHYPIPEMKGKAAIQRGFEWGMASIEKPGFTIRNYWVNGEKAVVELDTHHIFKGGMELKFPQVFVIETREGRVTRLQSYVPYPPPGIGGMMSAVTRLMWKLQGKA